jgi:hypothetical protein
MLVAGSPLDSQYIEHFEYIRIKQKTASPTLFCAVQCSAVAYSTFLTQEAKIIVQKTMSFYLVARDTCRSCRVYSLVFLEISSLLGTLVELLVE